MRTETVVCDRCKRDLRDVPAVLGPNGWTYQVLSINTPRMDLCGECYVALLAWIDLGEQA